MKPVPKYFLVYLTVAFISGCEKENMCDCLKSTGSIVAEKRSLDDFSEIEVRKNVIVTLYQDTVNYAEVEAGSHLIELIKTEVTNGVLEITNTNTCNWVRSYDVEVHVRLHLKKIIRLEHFGSEEIRCGNQLVTDEIDIRENNSADMRLNLQADRVFARQMIGGGDIYLTGSSRFCYAFGGSFGYIYAREFVSDSVQVDHRGTGDIYVRPLNWMGVYLADRGDVYYKGDPAVVESELPGSGRLIKE